MIDLELRSGVWARRPTRRELREGADDAWEAEFKLWSRRAVGITAFRIAIGIAAAAFSVATGSPLLEHAQLGDCALVALLVTIPTGATRPPRWRIGR